MEIASTDAMEKLRIICQSSKLSLIQAHIVSKKIKEAFPSITIEIIPSNSRGDRELNVPLHTLNDTDFFAKEIYEQLEKGLADVAVHSLKDLSAEHFFGDHFFAVVDRDDVRDVAIFNSNILEKCKNGEAIRIGTSSPRRELMAIQFLKRALPYFGQTNQTEAAFIRGNVETRLKKLDAGEFDGIILAAAGLNRLLQYGDQELRTSIEEILQRKQLMLLPILNCVPAPAQGAIVVETLTSQPAVVSILKKILSEKDHSQCVQEKKIAQQFGSGCAQKFGVATISTFMGEFIFASGKDRSGKPFSSWNGLPSPIDKLIYTGLVKPGGLFSYTEEENEPLATTKTIYIAHKRVLDYIIDTRVLEEKEIFASGLHTWFALAERGYWVTACADGLGMERFVSSMPMPLFSLPVDGFTILTHKRAAERWRSKGFHALSLYGTVLHEEQKVIQSIQKTDAVFWYSYSQYEALGKYAKKSCVHLCLSGETASLLTLEGKKPIVFPTINAFELWMKNSI